MELCIHEMVDDVFFDVKFDTKVCILSGDSGTGKTFLTGVLLYIMLPGWIISKAEYFECSLTDI